MNQQEANRRMEEEIQYFPGSSKIIFLKKAVINTLPSPYMNTPKNIDAF
ncbi:hypothetical protein ABW365_01475 [Enterococcus avium]